MKKILDWPIFINVLLLSLIGLISIYSGIHQQVHGQMLFLKAVLWVILGLILMVGCSYISYKSWYKYSLILYFIFLFLLILVLVIGNVVNGAQSWFQWGWLSLQPSELAKLAYIFILAKFLTLRLEKIKSLSTFILTFLISAPYLLLILKEPDFGTCSVYVFIGFIMLFLYGARGRYLFFLGCILALSMIVLVLPVLDYSQGKIGFFYYYGGDKVSIILSILVLGTLYCASFVLWKIWKRKIYYFLIYGLGIIFWGLILSNIVSVVLHPYQIQRLVSFLHPQMYLNSSGWNLMQSKIAIGSGGFWGQGLLAGGQAKLSFLPENTTDFIIALYGKAWGFLGISVFFMVMFILILNLFLTMIHTKEPFAKGLSIGILALFFYHFFINVGMCIGFMPIIGIPLLFVSYGGSSMLTACLSMGIIMNIRKSRWE